MIVGFFYQGSGLGDQLSRYITVRTLAEDKGYEYGMVGQFKGDFFLHQPKIQMEGFIAPYSYLEKDVRDEHGNDIRSYDPEIHFVKDETIVDGSFEDDKYWRHNLANIDKWLEVEPLDVPENTCIIGFRGGEYTLYSDLFLTGDYWDTAITKMREINPNMVFQVHTDDPKLAKDLFPHFEIIDNQAISHSKHTNMGFNWRSTRFAKYAIIPNSAFFIMPRILQHFTNKEAITIAPRYWAGRNTQVWKRPACFYKEFMYV